MQLQNPDPSEDLAAKIATRVLELMTRRSVLEDEESDQPAILFWPHPDRDSVVLIVDPMLIQNINRATAPNFIEHLEKALQGRRVLVVHVQSGLFYRVAYVPSAPAQQLQSRPLDLSRQPSPLHVPIGVTANGDLWLSLVEMDAVLIGGARRMGKTNLLHGWIAALLRGKETRLVLFDGKGGVEFARYAGKPRCQVIAGELAPALGEIFEEMNARFDILKAARVPSLADYNRTRGEGGRLERIVLVIDELAFAVQEPGVEDVLVDLTARGGAVGIHPVLATQRPSSDVVTPRLKGNLVTRIALPVPDRASSQVVLDRSGAEALAKTPGRLYVAYAAQLIEAQTFFVASDLDVAADPVLPASARLSDRERRVAEAAIAQDGWFKSRDLKTATGESIPYLVGLAQRWEVIGYLTEVQRNDRGHPLGRRVTAKLRAESGEPANLANMAESGESGWN